MTIRIITVVTVAASTACGGGGGLVLDAAGGAPTTQYTTMTYPGYAGDPGSYACPQPGEANYTPLPINLHVPNLPGSTVPLLVFFPGTADDLSLDQLTSDLPDAVVDRAAQLGFAAAAVAYRSLDFNLFFPDRMDAKERCAWAATPTSLVSQLCGNQGPLASSSTQIDCSKGIVVVGHSQGGIMALLATNYEPRVAAAYTLGIGIAYDASSACTNNAECGSVNALFPYLADPAVVTAQGSSLGTMTMGSATSRVLASSNVRAEAGDADPYFAAAYETTAVTLAEVTTRLNSITGSSCAAASPGSCGGSSGSGWTIVADTQLTPCAAATACTSVPPASHAGHCFMSNGNSVGCVNSLGLPEVWDPDPTYFAPGSTAGWTLDANLAWLVSRLP